MSKMTFSRAVGSLAVLGLSILALGAPSPVQAAPQAKIDICHKPGTPAEKTLSIPEKAALKHIEKHGDTMGPCVVAPPEPEFEPLHITEVSVDFEGSLAVVGFCNVGDQTLSIRGMGFDNGDPPVVMLGDQGELALCSASANEIVAQCPGGVCPEGDFRLTVQTGSEMDQFDDYDLTIAMPAPGGLSGHEIVTRDLNVPAGAFFGVGDPEDAVGARVDCPAGKKVVGGGFYVLDGVALNNIRGNGPLDEDTWRVQAQNDTGVDPLRVQLYAVCANAD